MQMDRLLSSGNLQLFVGRCRKSILSSTFLLLQENKSPWRDGTKCQDWEHKNVFLNHILIFVVILKKMTYLKKWYHYLLKILSIWLLQHEYFLWNLKYDNFQYGYYFSFDERRIFEIFRANKFWQIQCRIFSRLYSFLRKAK